jgi:hypothetical protein
MIRVRLSVYGLSSSVELVMLLGATICATTDEISP